MPNVFSSILPQNMNTVQQSSTPAFANFKPNTPLNMAYGGPSSVPSGSYSNNQQTAFGSVNGSQPKGPLLPGAIPGIKASANNPAEGIVNTQKYYGNATGTPTFNSQGGSITSPPSSYTPPTATPPPITGSSMSSTGSFTPSFGANVSTLQNYGTGNNNDPTVAASNTGLVNIGQGTAGTQNGYVNTAAQGLINLQNQYDPLITQNAQNYQGLVAKELADMKNQTQGYYQPANIEQGALNNAMTNDANQQTINMAQGTQLLQQEQNAANQLQSAGQLGQGQQNAQITALGQAGQQGTAQQGQNIGAAGTAGQLTQPVANAPYFGNPLTGGIAGGVNPGAAVYNANQITGRGALGTQNIQQQQAITAAGNQTNQLNDFLSSQGAGLGINSNQLNAVNAIYQKLAGQVSNPAYQQLHAMLGSIAQSYSGVLGYTPDIEQLASANGGNIRQVLATLQNQAQAAQSATQSIGQNSGTSGNTYKSPSGNTYNLPY